MDSLEAIPLPPPSRTFWNSNDTPTLDLFDETELVHAAMEASCSSTFLFPSTVSSTGCDVDDSDDGQTLFKQSRPSSSSPSPCTLFDEIPAAENFDAAESRAWAANPPAAGSGNSSSSGSGMENLVQHHCNSSSQFSSWQFSAPVGPLYHQAAPQGVSASLQGSVRGQLTNLHGDGNFFSPLNSSTHMGSTAATSTVLESGHGAKNQPKAPLMRRPSFRRPDSTEQLNAASKATWQSAADMLEPRRVTVSGTQFKEPLGSPCSVISGFTKVVDQFVSNDYGTMEISSSCFNGPSTSGKNNNHHVSCSQESAPASRAPEGGARSVSETQEIVADHGVVVKPLTTSAKRKRSKAPKHSNEVESQRMTHIAVERNRRKQMNEHLAALRALMPGSYVQKGDQASIVGGAIEFVKELEHLLHCLQAQKRRRAYSELSGAGTPTNRLAIPNLEQQHFSQLQQPFSFHSPQGMTAQTTQCPSTIFNTRLVDPSPFLVGADNSLGALTPRGTSSHGPTVQMIPATPAPTINLLSSPTSPASAFSVQAGSNCNAWSVESGGGCPNTGTASAAAAAAAGRVVVGEARSDMASVEVKLVGASDAGALVKIMALRRAGQLLRTVVALESLALTVLHTNITTVGHTVLYSFHVQIGALCRMNVDEIAHALHQTFGSLHALQF